MGARARRDRDRHRGLAEKARVALSHGCHHAIDYRREDFAARTLALTGGAGVDVVYDAVGKDVFLSSLKCTRPRGIVISYGTASATSRPSTCSCSTRSR